MLLEAWIASLLVSLILRVRVTHSWSVSLDRLSNSNRSSRALGDRSWSITVTGLLLAFDYSSWRLSVTFGIVLRARVVSHQSCLVLVLRLRISLASSMVVSGSWNRMLHGLGIAMVASWLPVVRLVVVLRVGHVIRLLRHPIKLVRSSCYRILICFMSTFWWRKLMLSLVLTGASGRNTATFSLLVIHFMSMRNLNLVCRSLLTR